MDTLTHALLGAVVVRASWSAKTEAGRVDVRTATLAGAFAAAFPDIDYLGFWVAPLTFLADWHRGPTHSLVLLPLWSLILGPLLALVYRKRSSWRTFVWICALALMSHIASDLITAYGTKILSPISSWRPALATTFVIDPYFSTIVIGALAAAVMLQAPFPARIGLLVLAAYLGLQVLLQHQAKDLGKAYVRAHALKGATIHPLPQPLSPFYWLIIVKEGKRYHVALVNLATWEASPEWYGRLGWLGRLQAAYQPRDALVWKISLSHGTDEIRRHTAEAVWSSEAFSEFRRFARFPVLYRIDETGSETCVWYTDLRYVLPGLTPPFRYGMCGSGGLENWGLYRLRRFTERKRQYLGGK